jgi:hypothetical protein
MKLELLLFATVALANLVADPLPNDESAIPVADELFPSSKSAVPIDW